MVQLHKKFTDGQVRAELEPQVKAWLKRVHPNDIKGVKEALALFLSSLSPFLHGGHD